MGGRVGGCVQHPLQHPPQIFVQAGEIHALPVEQGEHLVRQGLEVGHIAGQAADKQTDAVRHLGEHKGEQGGDHHHQSHIGGQHCQRTAEAVQLPPRQPPVVQSEKEGAGPVEHECDGEPEEQGLQRPQDLSRHGPYQVDLHQYQHQHHRVGDDQKDASQQIFVQRCPSLLSSPHLFRPESSSHQNPRMDRHPVWETAHSRDHTRGCGLPPFGGKGN